MNTHLAWGMHYARHYACTYETLQVTLEPLCGHYILLCECPVQCENSPELRGLTRVSLCEYPQFPPFVCCLRAR